MFIWNLKGKNVFQDFPGHPVVTVLHFLLPWPQVQSLAGEDPASHTVQPKYKYKYIYILYVYIYIYVKPKLLVALLEEDAFIKKDKLQEN